MASVTGRNVEDVQSEIEERLANRAIEPQVLITKISSRSAQASVLGDVKEPTKVQLSEAGDRVLDVISYAKGLSAPNIESYVTLIRRGKTARVNYNHLVSTPSENIYVVPGRFRCLCRNIDEPSIRRRILCGRDTATEKKRHG